MSIDEMLLQQAKHLVGAMDEAVDDALPHEIAEIVKSQRKRVFIKITSWFLPAAAGALAAVMTVPAFAQANDGLVPLGMTTVKPLGAVPGGTLVLPTVKSAETGGPGAHASAVCGTGLAADDATVQLPFTDVRDPGLACI